MLPNAFIYPEFLMSRLSGDLLEIVPLCQMVACVVSPITYCLGPHYHSYCICYHVYTCCLTIFVCYMYRAYGSGKEDSPLCDVPGFENCRMKLLRHVSFVNCPV